MFRQYPRWVWAILGSVIALILFLYYLDIVPLLFRMAATNRACERRFPSAVIAGIQKCGTSALGKFLGQHPEIEHAKGEPQFFSGKYNRGFEWYRNRMPCSVPGQITIEKSPPYFYRQNVPDLIRKFNPDMKIIIIVKDPIIRALSHYAMKCRGGDFHNATAFKDVVTDTDGEIKDNTKIIGYSSYFLYIKHWLHSFKRKQIYFVDGHSFESHPEEELRELEKFLNVSSYFRPSNFFIDQSKGKPCFFKDKQSKRPVCLSDRKGREHPEINVPLRKKMEDYFRPLNELFFEMIHERFDWGY